MSSRWRRLRLAAPLLACGLLAAITAVRTAAAAPPPARIAASQPVVALLRDHVARTLPSVGAPLVATLAARRPLTHSRTVVPVVATATSARGHRWLQVRVPGRATRHLGWIQATHTRESSTPWAIFVHLSARSVAVFDGGVRVRRFRAVVGAPATPTPRGQFFVEEGVALARGEPGAPFALATSARSSVLQEFDGGPGQIALHGTDGLSGALGTAASHGCVRLSSTAITWMARRIGAGVPVTVT
jgi:lipoprotein-anchoring transpeptidase ErfK/SrfK